MACQSGIRASAELMQLFARAKAVRANIRAIKIVVRDEQLTAITEETIGGDWQNDWARLLPAILDNEPCYVLMRLDENEPGKAASWVFVTFVPETAPVRQKMLLASCGSTLKSEFGKGYISDEIHGTTKKELSISSYEQHVSGKQTQGPLTDIEFELSAVKGEEVAAQKRAMAARSLHAQTVKGLAFPIDQSAQEQLAKLRDGHVNYVQLSVDTLNEAIKLERSENIEPNQLNSVIPTQKPRYHYYRYKHSHQGEACDSTVFIYSIPAGGCSIKERMLFSSCKGQFIDTVERFLLLNAERKVEIDPCEKIDEQYLIDLVHPPQHAPAVLFDKPKAPGGRGARRVIRTAV